MAVGLAVSSVTDVFFAAVVDLGDVSDSVVCLLSAGFGLASSASEESSSPDCVALVAFKGGAVSSSDALVCEERDEVSVVEEVAAVDSLVTFFGRAGSDSGIISS